MSNEKHFFPLLILFQKLLSGFILHITVGRIGCRQGYRLIVASINHEGHIDFIWRLFYKILCLTQFTSHSRFRCFLIVQAYIEGKGKGYVYPVHTMKAYWG
jgi:hypothetical protein